MSKRYVEVLMQGCVPWQALGEAQPFSALQITSTKSIRDGALRLLWQQNVS